MSKPSVVATRPDLSLTPMLASADDTVPSQPSHHVRLVPNSLGHNHGHKGGLPSRLHSSDRQNVVYAAAGAASMPTCWNRVCMSMRRV